MLGALQLFPRCVPNCKLVNVRAPLRGLRRFATEEDDNQQIKGRGRGKPSILRKLEPVRTQNSAIESQDEIEEKEDFDFAKEMSNWTKEYEKMTLNNLSAEMREHFESELEMIDDSNKFEQEVEQELKATPLNISEKETEIPFETPNQLFVQLYGSTVEGTKTLVREGYLKTRSLEKKLNKNKNFMKKVWDYQRQLKKDRKSKRNATNITGSEYKDGFGVYFPHMFKDVPTTHQYYKLVQQYTAALYHNASFTYREKEYIVKGWIDLLIFRKGLDTEKWAPVRAFYKNDLPKDNIFKP
jgi:hypothetical protein